MASRGEPIQQIGMSSIKQRRLALPVRCHPGERVGDYVPFYFCPRSIMLYVISCQNHPELAYRGGQDPIVHLEADLHEVVEWADQAGRRWAFSLRNAGAAYAEFRADVSQLEEINWQAIAATDWKDALVKEGKQAEFLVRDSFPWTLVRRVGVRSPSTYARAQAALGNASHQPKIEIIPQWYY